MYKGSAVLLVTIFVALLSGCPGVVTAPSAVGLLTTGSTVSMLAQSAPSKTASIQSFRLQVSSAVLNPGNVQLVAAPVTIDLTNVDAGAGFLSSASASAGTYSSVTVSFANPSITITNPSGSVLVIPGGSCAPYSTCTFVPAMTNSQVTVTTGAFPLSVVANSSASFALTMAQGKILQSDDSLDFSTGVDTASDQTSATISATGDQALNSELGTVKSVSAGQIMLVSESNDASPAIVTDASTIYNYPASVCAADNATCVKAGEIVSVTLSLTAAGTVHADSISYADAANAKLVEGTITGIATGGNSFQVWVNQSFGMGGGTSMDESITTVNVMNGALFAIDSVGYPAVAGGAFSGFGSLLTGQTVLIDIASTSVLPNINTDQIFLEDSDASGTISNLASNMTFLLTSYPAEQESSSAITSQVIVQTGTGTSYLNLSPASFSSLANAQSISARGPLFSIPAGPTISADQVSLHSASDQ